MVPGAPKHPDFVFPGRAGWHAPRIRRRSLDRGWQYLQVDDLARAEREFCCVRSSSEPQFYPAETALGYVGAGTRQREGRRRSHFDRALRQEAAYVPALVGRGQALLELDRDAEALASFEAALAEDPSLTDLRSRVDVLRVRAVAGHCWRARKKAADAQRWDEAAHDLPAGDRGVAGLGVPVSRPGRRGAEGRDRARRALEHYRKAVELDPTDAQVACGDRRHSRSARRRHRRTGGVRTGARRSMPTKCRTPCSPGCVPRAALAKLPPSTARFRNATAVTRADVAALIGVRLEALLARAPHAPGRSSPMCAAIGPSSGSRRWCAPA